MKKIFPQILLSKFESINPWMLVGIAAAVRIVFLFVFCISTKWVNYSPLQEPTLIHTGVDGYIQIAHTLLKSGQYALEINGPPVSFRPPIQPLLMLVFGAWMPIYWYIGWLFCATILGTASVWLLWRIAIMTQLSPLLTRVLLLVCALHPYLIFATRVPGIPAALIFMTTLVLYATIKCITSNGKNTFSAGVSWGIAILTHGCFLPLFLPVVFFIFTFTQDSWLMRIRRSFILCIVTVLVVSPWSFRNWLTFDRLIPVATGGALQYWIADYVYFHSDISDKDPISESFKQISVDFEKDNHRKLRQSHGGILSLEDDDLLSKKAKQQISSDPTILFARFFKGFTMFWVTMDRGIVKTIIVSLINVPFLLLAIILSLVMARRRCFTKEYAFVAVFILSFWCLFAIVQAVGPYFVAITPCLFFLICYGMNQISKQKSIA